MEVFWADILNKPTTFTPSAHMHAWGELTGVPATFTPSAHVHDDRYYTDTELATSGSGAGVHWDNILGKPEMGVGDMEKSIYDPDGDGVVELAAFANSASSVAWTGVTGKPATFPPESHTHDDRYYTESELQTSGQAQIHWGNLTNKPTIGDMLKATYDANSDGIVDHAAEVSWTGVTGKPNEFTPAAHLHFTPAQAATSALSGTKSLTDADKEVQYIDPNGASRDVLLPAVGANNHSFFIVNTADAAENLNIKSAQGTIIAALKQGEARWVVSNGTNWKAHSAGSGDMLKSVYDTNGDGIVDSASSVPWTGIAGKPSTFPPDAHDHDDRYYTQTQLQISGQAQVHWGNIINAPAIGVGDMVRSTYDANLDGIVDRAASVPWTGVTGKPDTYPADPHTHDDRYFTQTQLKTAGSGAQVAWANLINVPEIPTGDMETAVYDADGDGTVDQASAVPWTGVSGKPATFTPSAHTHLWTDLTNAPSVNDRFGISVSLGDGSSELSAGLKGYVQIPWNCMIDTVELVGDAVGTVVVDVWKSDDVNFPPVVGDAITGVAKPSLSSELKSTTDVSTWSAFLNAGDWLAFNVDSASTVKQVTLSIRGSKA